MTSSSSVCSPFASLSRLLCGTRRKEGSSDCAKELPSSRGGDRLRAFQAPTAMVNGGDAGEPDTHRAFEKSHARTRSHRRDRCTLLSCAGQDKRATAVIRGKDTLGRIHPKQHEAITKVNVSRAETVALASDHRKTSFFRHSLSRTCQPRRSTSAVSSPTSS